MSRTAVDTSAEVNVRVAFHLSKVPLISTDASTANLILLSTGVISKTGTPAEFCARIGDGNRMDAKRHKITTRMGGSVSLPQMVVNFKAVRFCQPDPCAHAQFRKKTFAYSLITPQGSTAPASAWGKP